jgi:hypothetical protein
MLVRLVRLVQLVTGIRTVSMNGEILSLMRLVTLLHTVVLPTSQLAVERWAPQELPLVRHGQCWLARVTLVQLVQPVSLVQLVTLEQLVQPASLAQLVTLAQLVQQELVQPGSLVQLVQLVTGIRTVSFHGALKLCMQLVTLLSMKDLPISQLAVERWELRGLRLVPAGRCWLKRVQLVTLVQLAQRASLV